MSDADSSPCGKFQAKNLIYLRISKRCVLMTKILIDPPHLSWFENNSKVILSKLMEILKPRILNKLHDESNSSSKKSKLDIYRGSGFQLGCYFRNLTYQHSILLKSRETIHPIETERASARKDDVKLDEVDTKPDLSSCSLKVNYEPFSIFGKSLVVIIEPFPLPGLSQTHHTPLSPDGGKAKATHPLPRMARSEKPLFIPDDDDEVLEDFRLDSNRSDQPHSTLLSQLIKDPTSDRQLDHKSQPQSLRLDDFLVPDSSSNK